MSYAEYRDNAIRWYQLGGPKYVRRSVINNTGLSRQVRRAHEREFDKVPLSERLLARLSTLYSGQGLFMQRGRPLFAGWPNEVRTPIRDYNKRYASLFPVLPDATDDQGRNGPGISAS